jgi:hypothetical protein
MNNDILIDDPADVEAWFNAELEASDAYQRRINAKRRAGQLIEAGQPLIAKAVLVLADLEAGERAKLHALRRRAVRVLAELPPA